MFSPSYTKKFEEDVKKMKKRGADLEKLKGVMRLLLSGESLPKKYRDHALIGNYTNRRECHIQPDWLLIYKLDSKIMIFERTGTHSDLFG